MVRGLALARPNSLLYFVAAVEFGHRVPAIRGDELQCRRDGLLLRICVQLVGGGGAVGEPLTAELQFRAEFGRLTVPWAKVQSVVPGSNSRPHALKQILADIEQLSDASFDKRDAHMANWRPMDRSSARSWRTSRMTATSNAACESKNCCWRLTLARRTARPACPQDLLVVPDQRHVGKIESSLLELKTAFGLLRVPLADVESAAPPIDTVAVDLLTKIDLQCVCVLWHLHPGRLNASAPAASKSCPAANPGRAPRRLRLAG